MGRTVVLVLPKRMSEESALMPTTEIHVPDNELERVEQWRAEELERVGYPAQAAAEIAARLDVDLHFAADLVENGCPPETAVRILL
jgi:hypothetical protein